MIGMTVPKGVAVVHVVDFESADIGKACEGIDNVIATVVPGRMPLVKMRATYSYFWRLINAVGKDPRIGDDETWRLVHDETLSIAAPEARVLSPPLVP